MYTKEYDHVKEYDHIKEYDHSLFNVSFIQRIQSRTNNPTNPLYILDMNTKKQQQKCPPSVDLLERQCSQKYILQIKHLNHFSNALSDYFLGCY